MPTPSGRPRRHRRAAPTAKSRGGPSSTEAVTRACERRSASEHHGLVPDSIQGPLPAPSPPSSGVVRVAARVVPGGEAAQTPQLASSGTARPAWSRMARASQWGSTVRAVVRSTAPSVARAENTRHVSRPTAGARAPSSRARPTEASTSPATARAAAATEVSPQRENDQAPSPPRASPRPPASSDRAVPEAAVVVVVVPIRRDLPCGPRRHTRCRTLHRVRPAASTRGGPRLDRRRPRPHPTPEEDPCTAR